MACWSTEYQISDSFAANLREFYELRGVAEPCFQPHTFKALVHMMMGTNAEGSIPFARVPVLGVDVYIASTLPTNRAA